jgi:hypothetical protein
MKTPYATIKISGGKSVKVDLDDKKRVRMFKWSLSAHRNGQLYAMRKVQKNNIIKTVSLHHFILEVDSINNCHVDHINGNGLDNRKSNLRIVSRTINALNTEKKKGYYFSKHKKLYICRTNVHGINFTVGRFNKEGDAVKSSIKFRKNIIKLINIINSKDIPNYKING